MKEKITGALDFFMFGGWKWNGWMLQHSNVTMSALQCQSQQLKKWGSEIFWDFVVKSDRS